MSTPDFEGRVYRALNPRWAGEPLSGEGARKFGGRFNPRGMPAFYCSLSPLTALREANQVGDLQPTTLVCYHATISRVFDTTSDAGLKRIGVSRHELAATGWRNEMASSGEARTQILARDLIAAGYAGMLVRSFARGTGDADLNLVLWKWGARGPSRLRLVDDENRLKP